LFNRSGNRYFDWIGFIYLPIFNSGLLDCKFPFDWVQGNIFSKLLSRLPMTDSLADWAGITLNPSKDG
jgi:hypothetical protein